MKIRFSSRTLIFNLFLIGAGIAGLCFFDPKEKEFYILILNGIVGIYFRATTKKPGLKTE